jgi:extradiol dioxygenase family protein
LAPLTLSTTALAFPATYVGAASAARQVTLSNSSTADSAAVNILSEATEPQAYSHVTNCPANLAPQASCTLWISFNPTSAGTLGSSLTVAGAASSAAQTLRLAGAGLANPPLTLSNALNSQTVFLGASIVQFWPLPLHNAGIYGQTTAQMLTRFTTDVLGHGYSRIVLLAGSNDITGGVSLSDVTIPNLQAMAQLASSAGLEVVLSLLPPITLNGVDYNAQVLTADAAIRQLAIVNGYLYVDYNAPMQGIRSTSSTANTPAPQGTRSWKRHWPRPSRADRRLPQAGLPRRAFSMEPGAGMSLTPFHIAFPVDDLAAARAFYGEVLGCPEGRSCDEWIDFDLFGHQIVAHIAPPKPAAADHHNEVDGKHVPVPHFGVVLTMDTWQRFAERLEAAQVKFEIAPYIRFKGEVGEQATMFFYDPAGNALEFKAFADFSQIFAK